MVKCSTTLDSLSAGDNPSQIASGLDTCASDIKSVEGSLKDKDVLSYATVNQEGISQYASLSHQLASVSPSDYSTRSKLLDQIYSVQDTAGKKAGDVESSLDKRFSDGSPTNELRKVTDALFNKTLSSTK